MTAVARKAAGDLRDAASPTKPFGELEKPRQRLALTESALAEPSPFHQPSSVQEDPTDMCKRLPIFAIALVTLSLLTMGLGVASAQDVFKINYFSNANTNQVPGIVPAPDATVRIDNPGVTGGNLCAMIYVFAFDQQLSECCGCVETPNGLQTLSVNYNLNANPLTGVKPASGVIKVVSAAVNNSPCDPTGNVTPTPNLRVWATHIQNRVGSAYPITETESSDATLGATELANIQAECFFIGILGSGHGICSCGYGD